MLITNDDGIDAAGLIVLEKALLEAGADVFVAAPDAERSGSSHSISLQRPLQIREKGKNRWAVTGTPVDTAHLAVNHIMKDNPPELIISGINRGANLGCDINYSGTVSAAREAAMLGIKSFAISLETFRDDPDFSPSARFAVRFARLLFANDPPERTFFNINLPDLPEDEIKGARVTVQGIRNYDNVVRVGRDEDGEKHYLLGGVPASGEAIPDSDITVVEQGYVSITPLRLDLTQTRVLDWLKSVINNGGPS